LLTSYSTEDKDTQILEEICHVITVGISVLYPSISDKNQLLQALLYDGKTIKHATCIYIIDDHHFVQENHQKEK
jgi:hypothetical protein